MTAFRCSGRSRVVLLIITFNEPGGGGGSAVGGDMDSRPALPREAMPAPVTSNEMCDLKSLSELAIAVNE